MKRMKKTKLLAIDEARGVKQAAVIVSTMTADMQDTNC